MEKPENVRRDMAKRFAEDKTNLPTPVATTEPALKRSRRPEIFEQSQPQIIIARKPAAKYRKPMQTTNVMGAGFHFMAPRQRFVPTQGHPQYRSNDNVGSEGSDSDPETNSVTRSVSALGLNC